MIDLELQSVAGGSSRTRDFDLFAFRYRKITPTTVTPEAPSISMRATV